MSVVHPFLALPEGWSVRPLVSLARKIGSGATPTGGKDAYLAERVNYALIRSQNVCDRQFVADGLAFISDSDAAKLLGVRLEVGDVLLNITGDGVTFGRACLAPAEYLPCVVNQHVSIVRCGPDLDPGFLLSFLTLPASKAYIESFNAGGSRRAITKAHIESFEVPLPPLDEQRRIAAVLGALDDKIELNRKQNRTLEAMAQAIFQSWFIDFGGHTDLVDSELGPIPRGWGVRSLYDSATYINGAAYRDFHFSDEPGALPVIKIAELKAGVTEQTKFTTTEVAEKYRIDDREMLFSWSGNPDTSIDTFIWLGGPGWLNQHIFRVVPHTDEEWYFVYYLLKHLRPEFAEIARNKQTTGLGHVTGGDMKRLKVVYPPVEALKAFNDLAAPLFERWYLNLKESRTLAALRDTLLPKLISGELRIPEATLEVVP